MYEKYTSKHRIDCRKKIEQYTYWWCMWVVEKSVCMITKGCCRWFMVYMFEYSE